MPEPTSTSSTTLDLRPMVRAARRVLIIFILLFIIDITMMIVSIMAYTGAHTDEDRSVVKETFITFTRTGHIVQRAIIALAAVGLVIHPTLAVVLMIRLGRIKHSDTYTPEKGTSLRRYFAWLLFPWLIVRIVAWAMCIAFQTPYVPVVFSTVLLECHHFGLELTQCGMVSTTWVTAMVYICMYILQGTFAGIAYYRLQESRPVKSTFVYEMVDPMGAANRPVSPPAYQLDPPSYTAEASSSPLFELPPAKKVEVKESRRQSAATPAGYDRRVI